MLEAIITLFAILSGIAFIPSLIIFIMEISDGDLPFATCWFVGIIIELIAMNNCPM